MNQIFANLDLGFSVALTLNNILYCFVGTLLGTLIGVLPGLGPVATIAMLLPLTFGLPPATALIMLAGIYYGAQYGGSTTAILLNIPGESSSLVTAVDGYELAKQGKAGQALAAAAIGSFVAGTLATIVIAVFSPLLASVALNFGPPEYFSLMVLGLLASISLASGSLPKALAMILLGLLLGLAGQDLYTGTPRLTLGFDELEDGFEFVAVAMGVFGVGEILRNLQGDDARSLVTQRVRNLMLGWRDMVLITGPVLRGTAMGALLGILPGGGAILSSFASYALEKKISSTPEQFGKGALAGVAGPESANNAGAQTSFIPMLTLGIPSNPVMALMIGALIIQGITPGPNVMRTQPELFWGIICSMWVGNLMLLLLNLPLVGLWVRLITIPYHLLFPAVIAFCCIGVYSIANNPFDVLAMAGFGALGFLLWRFGFEVAPLLLGFIIGPMLEDHMRRALLISRGNPMIFIERPISAAFLLVAFLAVMLALLPSLVQKREQILKE